MLRLEENDTKSPEGRKEIKYMTRVAFKKRSRNGETLVIIKNKIYNLTKWQKFHPGGPLALKHMSGHDATDAMIVLHPAHVMEKIHPFYIADLQNEDIEHSKVSHDFLKLNNELKELGLYKTTPWFYIREIIKISALFASILYLVLKVKTTASCFGAALLLGLMWHQVAFVAHDGILF
jgi:delta8-fatty-acid desaturase